MRSLTEQLLQSRTRLDSYERDIGCQLEHTEKLLETLVSEKEKNEQDLRDQLERVTAAKYELALLLPIQCGIWTD